MTLEITLRNMREEDLSSVLEVERGSYSVPWSEATFRGLLRRRDADLVVAMEGARIVGHAVFWHVLDQGELGNVAVLSDARGRGIGAILVEEIIQRAERRHINELFLEVRPSNLHARALYERFGFVQVGRRKDYYQEPTEDALVLRRLVGAASALE